jgi:hypothetical protein
MKPKQDQLRPLLDEILPGDEAQGTPSCAEVLGMVRAERVQRRQRRLMLGTVAMVAGVFLFSSYQASKQPLSAPVKVAMTAVVPEKPTSLPVQRINDDELLALLQDAGTASALMEWPNGERTLLIVEHQREK